MALVAVLPSPEQSLFDRLVRVRVSDSGLSMAAKANMEGGGGRREKEGASSCMGEGEEEETEKGWVEGKTRGDLKFKGKSGAIAAHSWACDDRVKREGESRQELTREYRVLACLWTLYIL